MLEHDDRSLEPDAEQAGAEFDLLLRSSLETYADPGSDSGLAGRVLDRIAAEGECERTRRTDRIRCWAIALPIAACLIIAIALLNSRPLHRSTERTNQARVTQPRSSNAGSSGPIANTPAVAWQREDVSRPLKHSSRASARTSAERLPKLDVFPTPQPLTREEQALVAYVARVPEAERKSLVEDQKRMDAPLTIEALEIKPLAPPEPQGN